MGDGGEGDPSVNFVRGGGERGVCGRGLGVTRVPVMGVSSCSRCIVIFVSFDFAQQLRCQMIGYDGPISIGYPTTDHLTRRGGRDDIGCTMDAHLG